MGYSYPAYVDWDNDGLPDLMLANETNRIFWYKNVGTRKEPRFGPRQQVICDGFPDSAQQREHSAALADDPQDAPRSVSARGGPALLLANRSGLRRFRR